MFEALPPTLPDGSAPPNGDAALVLGFFERGAYGRSALSRREISRKLAGELGAARPQVQVNAVIDELVAQGMLLAHKQSWHKPRPCEDQPGGLDESFAPTRLGAKAGRLCALLGGHPGVVGGFDVDGVGLDDQIIAAIDDEHGTHFSFVDVACCRASTEVVRAAADRLVAAGTITKTEHDWLELTPEGAARRAPLNARHWRSLTSALAGGIAREMASAPPGEEGRDLRAAAFEARAFHPKVVDLDRRKMIFRLTKSMSPHSIAICSPARAPV